MIAEITEESSSNTRREVLALLVLAAVQFTNIVDFMIVMPLGPVLTQELSIGPKEFGWIVSSYTFAAGVAGLIAAAVVDRFGRRSTFMVLYSGFLLGTLLCAIAPNYQLLVSARVLTGAFGGIISGITYAIIGDVFPEHRRGRATGALMIGFSLASVAGVPAGLWLGNSFGWHTTFLALAVFGLPALLLTPLALPPLNAHVGKRHGHPLRAVVETFTHANHLRAFAMIVALMIGSFTVFPSLSLFLVGNVHLTKEQLPWLYIVGGVLTLMTSPYVGWLADKHGKLRVYRFIAPGSALLILVITHLPPVHVTVAVAVFAALMVCNAGRMIPAMAMVTSSVEPRLRGAFLSANSSVQHIAAGLGAQLAAQIISESPGHGIDHFGTVGWIAALSTLSTLWLAGRVRVADAAPVSAEAISLAAAAEAEAAEGEPVLGCVE